MKRGLFITALLLLAGVAMWWLRQLMRPTTLPPKPRTVEQVREVLDSRMEKYWRPLFARAEISYPPQRLVLLGLKEEKRLEVYAGQESTLKRVTSYPLLAASGGAGPKLKVADKQVPEGFYRIELLNPNSSYHLSLRVNYPNDDDLARATEEGRNITDLGGDIMIHGGAGSSGCLAMGDPAIEEIFSLVAQTGLDHTELVILPWDFRIIKDRAVPTSAPGWTSALYERLRKASEKLP